MERDDRLGRRPVMQHAAAPPAPIPATMTRSDARPAATGPPPPADPADAAVPVALDFAAFYERSRASLGRAIALALGDVDLAAEAVDEAYTRAYERWATVATVDRPEGWVYRVAMNWSLSVLRRRRRGHHRFYDPAAQHVEPPGTAAAEPAIDAALAALDPKHRAVVVCRHFLGWSVADTAAALGVREGTVKSRLHRATAVLQSHLAHLRITEELS